MKKVFLAILTLLYLSSSIGITLHKHYCINMVSGGMLSHEKCKKADTHNSEKINGNNNECCKIENKFFKDDNDQELPGQALRLKQVIAVALPPSFIEMSSDKPGSITPVNSISHAPPLNRSISIYIRNCVFLI